MSKNIMWMTAAGLGAAAVLMGAAQSVVGKDERPASDETLLVAVKFNEGVWTAEPMLLLPCPSPSKPLSAPAQQMQFVAYNEKGETLYRFGIMDPRIILVEDPRELTEPLKHMEFVARLPYTRGLSKVDVNVPRERKEPVASVEISKVLAEYEAVGGIQQKAVCQVPGDRVDAVMTPAPPFVPSNGDAVASREI